MDETKILVLTSSTGSGHDRRADAFKEWAGKIHGCGVVVRIEHVLENSSALLRFGVNFYNAIQKNAPFLHNIYWWIVEWFGAWQGRRLTFGHRYYCKLIEVFRPHLILSMHDSTNRGYFSAAKKILGDKRVSCATYCGEFSGGFGYSRLWLSPDADFFYSRNEEAEAFAVKLGMSPGKCRIFCNLLPPQLFREQLSEGSRGQFRARTLGLSPDKFTVFLATGRVGANHHLAILELMRESAEKIQAIAVCGQNSRIYGRLAAWKSANPAFSLYLEGQSGQVHRFLQAADAVFARGGSNTAAEALFFNCPMIFDAIGGIMPQERLTVNYFVKKKAAVRAKSPRELVEILKKWADNPDEYRKIKAKMSSLRATDLPETFVGDMLNAAKAAQEASK